MRAAAAFCLGGAAFQDEGPEGDEAFVPGGMFTYLLLPRRECVSIRQVTCW